MADSDQAKLRRLYDALHTITQYDSPEKLRKRAEKDYGLTGDEAIEMAYENVLETARQTIKNMRRPPGEPR